MLRRLAPIAVTAMIAGVVPVDAEAKPRRARTTASATKKKSKPKKSKPKKSKRKTAKRTKRKREKPVPRIPDRTTNVASNMPPGFRWPPTRAMEAASDACEAHLDQLGITWERGSPEGRIVRPVIVPSMELGGVVYTSVFRKPPHKLDCQLARTLATFGTELHALGVREVKFGSIYRNTTVRVGGKSKNILSRHALGIAVDVVSFVDESGREVNVEHDYPNNDPLLLAVEEAINRSGKFRAVLTPRNDPKSHDDHFHIEAIVDYDAP